MVLCVLAADEEDAGDIALQIHFTLLQAFCCDNDINILRVSGMRRLAQLLDEDVENGTEPRDLHCILVTVSPAARARARSLSVCASRESSCLTCPRSLLQNPPVQPLQSPALQDVSGFCEESRYRNQWVPSLQLQDR